MDQPHEPEQPIDLDVLKRLPQMEMILSHDIEVTKHINNDIYFKSTCNRSMRKILSFLCSIYKFQLTYEGKYIYDRLYFMYGYDRHMSQCYYSDDEPLKKGEYVCKFTQYRTDVNMIDYDNIGFTINESTYRYIMNFE